MGFEEWIGLAAAGLVMLLGLIGTIVPGIPGAPLVLIAAAGHKFYFKEASASYTALGILVFLTLFSLLLEFLASVLGAKKLGATWRGMLGAIVGATIGIFFSLPGIILGPIIGAFLFEFAGGREWQEAARAGAGAMLGLVLGTIGKIACCVIMIVVFIFSAMANSSPPELSPTHVASVAVEQCPSDAFHDV